MENITQVLNDLRATMDECRLFIGFLRTGDPPPPSEVLRFHQMLVDALAAFPADMPEAIGEALKRAEAVCEMLGTREELRAALAALEVQ